MATDPLESLRLDSIERARKGILGFTLYTKPDYKVNWHHRILCNAINRWLSGEWTRLMVFMPPGHGKSEITSRRLPAFLHGIDPDSEIMGASYSSSLADDMTADVQKIIDSPAYRDVFPETRIVPEGERHPVYIRNREEHHILGHAGKYRGQGVGGSFTGKRAKYGLIDDPIKGRQDADSVAFREMLWKWYSNDFRTRVAMGGMKILLTQTRWHEDDLAGRLLELAKKDKLADQWHVLILPAVREDMENADDPRELGAALWPDAYPLKELYTHRAADLRAFEALYQQTPVSGTGQLFKSEMFDFTEMPPLFDYTFVTADTAYKDKQENDFHCFTAWGVLKGEPYINDVWMEQLKANDVEAPAERFIRQHMRYGFRGAYIEPKGHGIYLNEAFRRKGIMIPSENDMKEFFADRRWDKVERANNVVPHLANRKVHINKNLANKEQLVAQALKFPRAKHDDFVDTLIDGVKLVFTRQVGILDVL